MKIIVITKPTFFEGEAKQIIALLQSKVDFLHIRKPNAKAQQVASLLEKIPEHFYPKLKIHYYQELLTQFPLIDFHHSSKTDFIKDLTKNQSKSTHSLASLINRTQYHYQFISPVFESISKQGYTPNFSIDDLNNYLTENGISNAVALGGIDVTNVHRIKTLPLYGIALLGAIWREQPIDQVQYIEQIKEQLI